MLDIEKIKEERLSICKMCPLYKEGTYGAVCNSSKYISPDGKDWSWFKKEGYKQGCGCMISKRISKIESKCVIGKW